MKSISNQKIMVDVNNVQSFYLDSLARDNLKNIIKNMGLSQRRLAEKSNGGISYGFLKMLLSGQTSTISKEKLLVVCEILDIEPDDIFSNSAKFTVGVG